MTEQKTIDISNITDSLEKDIMLHLKKHGECIYGEIIRELQVSTSRGQEAIFALLKQGLISVDKSSQIRLNIDIAR